MNGPASDLGFSALLEAHAAIDDALLLHEEALLLLDVELAIELLAAHGRLLAVHMRHEEDVVLDAFRHVPPVKKWPVVLYTGQHEKLLWHLARMTQSTLQLRALSGSTLRRAAITLLDLEATYKHLHEHHDGAEREGLFPLVDHEATLQAWRDRVPALLAEWRAALQAEELLFAAARGRLDSRAARLNGA